MLAEVPRLSAGGVMGSKKLCSNMTQTARSRLSGRISYIGSRDHKQYPTRYGFEAHKPPRPDASRCELANVNSLREGLDLLRQGVQNGWFSEIDGPDDFPKYVWTRRTQDGQWFEARALSHPAGAYKGYPLEADELPGELRRAR